MEIKKFLANLMPFIVIGITIALVFCLLFLFFYILLWGLLIGGVLWLAAFVKSYFFPPKTATNTKEKTRIIEHDDHK